MILIYDILFNFILFKLIYYSYTNHNYRHRTLHNDKTKIQA